MSMTNHLGEFYNPANPAHFLLPARLTAAQTAAKLGFEGHDISCLVAAKLLKPLGKPAPNCVKYFAAVDVFARFNDVAWLEKATEKIYGHWREKNARNEKLVALELPETALAA